MLQGNGRHEINLVMNLRQNKQIFSGILIGDVKASLDHRKPCFFFLNICTSNCILHKSIFQFSAHGFWHKPVLT